MGNDFIAKTEYRCKNSGRIYQYLKSDNIYSYFKVMHDGTREIGNHVGRTYKFIKESIKKVGADVFELKDLYDKNKD